MIEERPAPTVLVVQNSADDPLGQLGLWLVEAGLHLEVCAPYFGEELPQSLEGYAALLVLGGGMGAIDDAAAPWLPRLRALLAQAVSSQLPTWGVCLGSQLLAVATGGRVERNPLGPEFGAQLVAKRAAAANDPLWRELPITPDVMQWHFDAVTALPPSAVLLASSPGCEVQAFRVGPAAWGTQFHVETTPEMVRHWAAVDAQALEGYDTQALLARSDAAHEDLAQVWPQYVAAFAALARHPSSGSSQATNTLLPMATPQATQESVAAPITDPAAIRAALAAQMQAARTLPPEAPEPPEALESR